MRSIAGVGLVWVAMFCGPRLAAGECRVWTVSQTVRVLRDARPGPMRAVRLAAARNEWESFQVLLRSDQPVSGVTLAIGDLAGPAGQTLPGRLMRLYRQHQFEITQGTYRNEDFHPGWYPDALIPFAHPLTGEPLGGGRYRAVPFELPAGQTHGFWVDVYVPPGTAAGSYRGTCRVAAAVGPLAEIPVQVSVWDFELPATPTLVTALGSPAQRLRGYYAARAKAGKEAEPKDWDAVDRQVAEMLSRHRINATPPAAWLRPVAGADGRFAIPAEKIDALREFVDRYHVNALQTPRPNSVVRDPQRESRKLHAWLAAWDRAAQALDRPQVVFYTYLKDEPNDEAAYRYVRQWGQAIRQAHSALKVMVVEQTWTQNEAWGTLHGAVDIWCPLFPLFKPASAAGRQALGETVWTYTALCQRDPTPWWHTDFPLLNYRVPAWIAWRYHIRGLLYWGGMCYWNDVDDPWTEPGTLDRRDQRKELIYNGEGSLVYPGRAAGYEGIAPSLRVKALRDAIEDYEYLAMLERGGKAAAADEIVRPLAESWFAWEKDPVAYEGARRKLARMIEALPKQK